MEPVAGCTAVVHLVCSQAVAQGEHQRGASSREAHIPVGDIHAEVDDSHEKGDSQVLPQEGSTPVGVNRQVVVGVGPHGLDRRTAVRAQKLQLRHSRTAHLHAVGCQGVERTACVNLPHNLSTILAHIWQTIYWLARLDCGGWQALGGGCTSESTRLYMTQLMC